jgi:hypothetical protein
MQGLALAADDTEGFQPLIDTVRTKVALLHPVVAGAEPQGIEGAGGKTALAAVALWPALVFNGRLCYPGCQSAA